jgi:hypothetical protein
MLGDWLGRRLGPAIREALFTPAKLKKAGRVKRYFHKNFLKAFKRKQINLKFADGFKMF